jgi:hypothetical protein
MNTVVTEEVKKIALEKSAHVKIYHINLLLEVIDLATRRGAFKGNELSQIGVLYDTLATGLNKAYASAEEEVKKNKLPEPVQQTQTQQTPFS